MERKKVVVMTDWTIVGLGENPNYSNGQLYFYGKIDNHPVLGKNEGRCVITSLIVGKMGSKIITKSGTAYRLGRIDKYFAKLYPGARKKLFDALEEVKV